MKIARLRADILAGLTSSFALVPECIAFALVAQVNPLMGLYGLGTGRPAMVRNRHREGQCRGYDRRWLPGFRCALRRATARGRVPQAWVEQRDTQGLG